MAFVANQLSCLTNPPGIKPDRFMYKSLDDIPTVTASGFFDSVQAMLAVGDIVDIVVVDNITNPTTAVTATLFISGIS